MVIAASEAVAARVAMARAIQQERFARLGPQAPTTNANPLGGATDPEAAIQFDRKGVNFDPWLRRFVAQVRRNWFVPQAAMVMSGHVVLQFNIHRSGEITDVAIIAHTRYVAGGVAVGGPVAGVAPAWAGPSS